VQKTLADGVHQAGLAAEPRRKDIGAATVEQGVKQRVVGVAANIKLAVADKAAGAIAQVLPDQLIQLGRSGLGAGAIPERGKEAAAEVEDAKEAQLDVEAVLKEYLRMDRELSDRAKDLLDQKKLPYGQFFKTKKALAEERGFALGDEATGWVATQVIESFMHSPHIAEVFADDATMRKKVRDVLRKHMAVDEQLDEEVRRRIKNLEEGTATWEIEYNKVMEQMKRKHGLE